MSPGELFAQTTHRFGIEEPQEGTGPSSAALTYPVIYIVV